MEFSKSVSEIARSHRTIRSFKPDPLSESLVRELIECALRSSSSGNTQCWSVISTEDPVKKNYLYQAHKYQNLVKEAPLLLTFCGDYNRMSQWLKIREAASSYDDLFGFLTCFSEAIIAAQTVAMVAESKGLGICYLGTTLSNGDIVAKILNLPKMVMPATTLAIGYPNESPNLRDRLPVESLFFKESYPTLSDEQIADFYKEKEVHGWRRYAEDPVLSKKVLESNAQNLAQLYTSKFKNAKSYHIETSKKILEFLKNQGFWNF